MFEKILVTGGTGFIGRYVLDRLIRQGTCPVAAARRPAAASPDLDFVELDITDVRRVQEIVSSVRPDAVIHLAGIAGSQDPDGTRCHDINVTGTRNLLEALSQSNCEGIVMIGSAAEYGTQKTPFREIMSPLPASPYGRSKAEATALAMEMYAESGLPVTVLRVFTAYGIGQPEKMFLPLAINHALRGIPFAMTDGSQRRDHVHVEDVADAVVAALETDDAVGRIINIGSGTGVKLATIAEKVWELSHADPSLLTVGEPGPDPDSRLDTEADISLAKKLLNWSPKIPLFDTSSEAGGLTRMFSHMRDKLR